MYGAAALRTRTLSAWGVLPFVLFSVGELVAVTGNLGYFGATLWVLFGIGWTWLGLSLLVEAVAAAWRARRKTG